MGPPRGASAAWRRASSAAKATSRAAFAVRVRDSHCPAARRHSGGRSVDAQRVPMGSASGESTGAKKRNPQCYLCFECLREMKKFGRLHTHADRQRAIRVHLGENVRSATAAVDKERSDTHQRMIASRHAWRGSGCSTRLLGDLRSGQGRRGACWRVGRCGGRVDSDGQLQVQIAIVVVNVVEAICDELQLTS